MADENATAAPAAAPAQATDLGGTIRVTPAPPGEANPSLEETAAAQALANETPEQKAEREAAAAKAPPEETPEAKATREAAEAAAAKDGPKPPMDFKGTVFEGLSEDMQGKISPFAAAFAENGTLTDAEVAEAATATGFSEAAVRQFMAGATVPAAQAVKPVFDAFGGEDQFREFQGWSREAGNLTDAEDRIINKALEAGDTETAAELMKAPMARWKAAGGGTPARDITNASQGAAGSTPGDSYESWAQVQADMGKPEYAKDPAFRKRVEQKMARSPNI